MYKLQLLLFCFLFGAVAYAQPDTTRRDTTWSGSPHAPYRNAILDADVLEGHTVPQSITATGQRMCFDKKMKIKTVTSRGPAEVCVFINTKIGLIGYTPLKPGSDPVCDIKPDLSDFRFSVIGLKGNVYNYINNKKKDVLEHWVQTSNSQQYQYQFSSSRSNVALRRKTERRDYCDGKVKAQLYKVDGKPEEWFLFGKQFPDAVMMTPQKYLGTFAVGYQFSDKGLFIIMQMVSSGLDSKIISIEDVQTCFDPSPFKVMEDERQTKMQQTIQRQRQKIAQEETKREKYPSCQNKKTTLLNFQKQALDRQEQNLQEAGTGNAMQEVRTQQAQANLMNYDDAIQQMIYETELKLCRAEQQLSEMSEQTSASSRQKQQEKISCLNRQLAVQRNTQQSFQRINTQYRNEPGKQYAEKAKAMMRGLVGCD